MVTTRGGPFAGVDARTIRRRAAKMLQHLGLRAVELSVALVDDGVMRALNRDHRSIDRPTDVLAFAMDEGGGPAVSGEERRPLGDVIISVPTARRQSDARGRAVGDEVTMLLAHGLLHLLGYDHATRPDERRMRRLTAELEAAAHRKAALNRR